MLPRNLLLAPLLLGIALLLIQCGCGDTAPPAATTGPAQGTGPDDGTGQLKVSVTDAPFPSAFVASASVVIREIRVHRADASEEGGSPWLTVFEGATEIDLIPLTGGVADAVVAADVPVGTYDQVRLLVEAGTVVLTDEAVVQGADRVFDTEGGDLKFPSGSQTGIQLKIDNDIVVESRLSADLLLDFDLGRSFVFNGPPLHPPGVKRVIFTPVVRATNASVAGTLVFDTWSDAATPDDPGDDAPLAGATVRLTDAQGAQVAMALSDAAGHVSISVAPGSYDVSIEAAGHEPAALEDQQVVLANQTDAGVVLLAASEAEIVGVVRGDRATPDDPDDDVVLPGVLVEVRADGSSDIVAQQTTDAQGSFQFSMLPPGVYDLTFSKDGYAVQVVEDVQGALPGQGQGLLVALAAYTGDVQGTVFDGGSGVPLSGATVLLVDAEGTSVAGATTDEMGAYLLPGVPSGAYLLVVQAEPAREIQLAVEVVGTEPPGTQVVDVQLP